MTYTLENESINRHPCPSSNNDINPKSRWDKCDLQSYSDILQTVLQRLDNQTPVTLLDIVLMAMTFNKVLYVASAVSTPKKTVTGTQKKRKLSSWNDKIAIVVKRSK